MWYRLDVTKQIISRDLLAQLLFCFLSSWLSIAVLFGFCSLFYSFQHCILFCFSSIIIIKISNVPQTLEFICFAWICRKKVIEWHQLDAKTKLGAEFYRQFSIWTCCRTFFFFSLRCPRHIRNCCIWWLLVLIPSAKVVADHSLNFLLALKQLFFKKKKI